MKTERCEIRIRGWTKYLRKLGAVLVTSMGLKMLIGGLLLLRG